MVGPASERRLARLRRVYDAILAGDLDEVMAGSAPEIEWRNPEQAVEPGTRRGRTSFAEAVAALLEQFDYERFEILDSAENGDVVALKLAIVGTGRASGAPVDTVFGQVFRFDGDRVAGFEWTPDPASALAAVGAERWPGEDPDDS